MGCNCWMHNIILAVAVIVFMYGYGAGWGSWSMWLVYLSAALIGIHSLVHREHMDADKRMTSKRR